MFKKLFGKIKGSPKEGKDLDKKEKRTGKTLKARPAENTSEHLEKNGQEATINVTQDDNAIRKAEKKENRPREVEIDNKSGKSRRALQKEKKSMTTMFKPSKEKNRDVIENSGEAKRKERKNRVKKTVIFDNPDKKDSIRTEKPIAEQEESKKHIKGKKSKESGSDNKEGMGDAKKNMLADLLNNRPKLAAIKSETTTNNALSDKVNAKPDSSSTPSPIGNVLSELLNKKTNNLKPITAQNNASSSNNTKDSENKPMNMASSILASLANLKKMPQPMNPQKDKQGSGNSSKPLLTPAVQSKVEEESQQKSELQVMLDKRREIFSNLKK
ncbi:MAG: hypothetical protein MHMPM18_000600 [Marteilia pararefringens]